MAINPYDVLGLSVGASTDEIRQAYRQRVLTSHPDKGGDAMQFNQVQKAFDILQDPCQRCLWDARRAAAETAPEVVRSNLEREDGTAFFECRCGELVVVSERHVAAGVAVLLECSTCSLLFVLV